MAGNLVQDPKTEKCSYFVLKTVEVATFYCHIWPFSRFFRRWFPVFFVQILSEILPLLELAPVRTSPAVPYILVYLDKIHWTTRLQDISYMSYSASYVAVSGKDSNKDISVEAVTLNTLCNIFIQRCRF